MKDEKSLENEITSLREHIDKLEKEVSELRYNQDFLASRLRYMEETVGMQLSTIPAPSSPPAYNQHIPDQNYRWTPTEVSTPWPVAEPEKQYEPRPADMAHNQPKQEDHTSLEEDVGIKWFARIGMVALVIGVGFFVKYAIDNNWIGYSARIGLGLVFGLTLMIIGEVLTRREKYAIWARALVGGGIGLTYFMVYAAYHFPDYRDVIGIGLQTDIVLLILVVGTAVVLSLKDKSRGIAVVAFSLGYITTLLSGEFEMLTLVYGLALTVALVLVVSIRRWPAIGLAGVFAAYIFYLLWGLLRDDTLFFSSIILFTYFAAFSFQSFVFMRMKESKAMNSTAIVANSILFFLLYYYQMDVHFPHITGLLPLGLSVFYLYIYIMSRRMWKEYATIYLYLATAFSIIFVPIQFSGTWIIITWSVLASFLALLSVRLCIRELEISAHFAAAFVFFILFFSDLYKVTPLDLARLSNNYWLLSALFVAATFYIISTVLSSNKPIWRYVPEVYLWAGAYIVVFLIFMALQRQVFWISIALSIFTAGYYLAYTRWKTHLLYQSMAFALILLVKLVLVDTTYEWQTPFNYMRLFAFLSAASVFYFITWHMRKNKDVVKESTYYSMGYSLAAAITLFFYIVSELDGFWISAGWGVLALTLMLGGFILVRRDMRIQGIIVFTLTTLKVFLYDTRNLETLYRTLSYISLGTLLLIVSFVYSKYRERLREMI